MTVDREVSTSLVVSPISAPKRTLNVLTPPLLATPATILTLTRSRVPVDGTGRPTAVTTRFRFHPVGSHVKIPGSPLPGQNLEVMSPGASIHQRGGTP
jgi:hypothetical protein